MCTFSKKEREAVSIFLTDLCHERTLRKAFAHLCDTFSELELQEVIEKLVKNGTLSGEDRDVLFKTVARFFA